MARYLDEIPVSEFEDIRSFAREVHKVFPTVKEFGDTLDTMRDVRKNKRVIDLLKSSSSMTNYDDGDTDEYVANRLATLEDWISDVEGGLRQVTRDVATVAAPTQEIWDECDRVAGIAREARVAIDKQNKIIEQQTRQINDMVELVGNLDRLFKNLSEQTELRLIAMEEQITRSANKSYGAF